ncbi:hypothetical protein GCM10020227_30310 [Streptomyces flavovirens]
MTTCRGNSGAAAAFGSAEWLLCTDIEVRALRPDPEGASPPGAASVYTRAPVGRWRVSDGAPH